MTNPNISPTGIPLEEKFGFWEFGEKGDRSNGRWYSCYQRKNASKQ
jgi:hypothetical protein